MFFHLKVSQVWPKRRLQKTMFIRFTGPREGSYHMPLKVTGEAVGFGPVAEGRKERRA